MLSVRGVLKMESRKHLLQIRPSKLEKIRWENVRQKHTHIRNSPSRSHLDWIFPLHVKFMQRTKKLKHHFFCHLILRCYQKELGKRNKISIVVPVLSVLAILGGTNLCRIPKLVKYSQMLNAWYIYLHLPQNYPNVGNRPYMGFTSFLFSESWISDWNSSDYHKDRTNTRWVLRIASFVAFGYI